MIEKDHKIKLVFENFSKKIKAKNLDVTKD